MYVRVRFVRPFFIYVLRYLFCSFLLYVVRYWFLSLCIYVFLSLFIDFVSSSLRYFVR